MYENVVYETTSKIKEIARSILNGRWKEFVIGCLIYYILFSVAQDVLGVYFSITRTIEYGGLSYLQPINYGGSIYDLILGGAIELGFAMFALNFFRTKKIDNSLLFEGFSHFGKAMVLNLLISLFTALWCCLFVIPGIVAMYRYRLAYYIMLDHPEYSPIQCIRESKRLMTGNKGRLFGLDLSFIGWGILALMPFIIFDFYYLYSSFVMPSLVEALVYSALSLPVVVVLAYRKTSEVAFYQLATRRLVVVTPNQPYGYGNMNGGNNGYNGYTEYNGYNNNGGYNDYNGYGGNGEYQGGNNNVTTDNQVNYPQEPNNYNQGEKQLQDQRRDIDKEPDNSRDLD